MVAVQKLKESEITEQDSLLLTRNLLRIAIFNISYIRGLFPEKYFNDKSVPALEMKIKKLMPMDAESRRLIDWMEKGVYDALQRKYLKTLLFCICEELEGPMIEEYAFSFSYSSSDSEEVLMNVNRNGNKKQGATFKSNTTEITPNQMRSSACKMVRTLVQLMRTLDRMPDQRTILMKLLYYDEVTPIDYEPPFFRICAEQEANNLWSRNPLKMEVGNVNSKHFVLALKVKSVLDPCEDENDDLQEDDEVSLGGDSLERRSNDSSSDSELEEEQYMVALAGDPECKQRTDEGNNTIPEDDTQDVEEEGEKLSRVRDWIVSRHTDFVDLTDILSNFPDISMVLTEEIVEKLSSEGLLTKAGRDSYNINKPKKRDSGLGPVKEETDIPEEPIDGKRQERVEDDHMYMKALYYALPMDYVSISKLQSKLEGVANQNTVRKLLDKMAHDGYIEGKSNRRLGKRVIHSELTNRKLLEIKKALDNEAMLGAENNRPSNKSNGDHIPVSDTNVNDVSTCGGLHSIGSDLTRTRGKSGSSARSEQTSWAKPQEQALTPINMAGPTASRESTIPGNGEGGVNAKVTHCEALEVCRSTQEKKSRKASTVKEPIVQYVKRQKSQLA